LPRAEDAGSDRSLVDSQHQSNSPRRHLFHRGQKQRISQFFPAPAQPFARVSSGALTVVNPGSPFVARSSGRREEVACFSSPKDLGRQPLDVLAINGGLDALKAKFDRC